jgi:hypothetical protein
MGPTKPTPVRCSCAAHDDDGRDLDVHAADCARKVAFHETLATTLIMTDARVACGLHRLPFRDRWPSGFAVFTVEVFRAVTAIPGIWDEVRELAKLPAEAELSPKLFEAVLDKRPACCRVSPATLVELYAASGIGHVKICTYCGRFAKGTAIETLEQGRINHVCFACMSTASTTPQGMQ